MDKITVHTTVKKDVQTVWDAWTNPEHITKWCFASSDWHAPEAENDVRTDGTFRTRMAAKDGSTAFDFAGTYTNVVQGQRIEYEMEDGRQVSITFSDSPEGVIVTEAFDPETENSAEKQREGWQAILDNFRIYTEGL